MNPPARRQLLITADDFGWTSSQNEAVRQGAAAGTLHRASLLCNGEGFADAVTVARAHPALGVGVHLTLCEGPPLTEPHALGPLCRADRRFHDGLGPLVQTYAQGRLPLAAIELEWRAQIDRAVRAGLRLSHFDGHKHVHLLPPLFDLTVRLAQEYGVSYVRVPQEAPSLRTLRRVAPWAVLHGLSLRARRRLQGTGLVAADHFVGFADSGGMNAEKLLAAIRTARPGVTEIMLHPAAESAGLQALRGRYDWARRYRFADELAALCHPDVRRALSDVGSIVESRTGSDVRPGAGSASFG